MKLSHWSSNPVAFAAVFLALSPVVPATRVSRVFDTLRRSTHSFFTRSTLTGVNGSAVVESAASSEARRADYIRLDPHRPPPSRRALTTEVWIIQDVYQGATFFDDWNFVTYPDPTHGQVVYVSRDWAFSSGMAYINDQGQAIMQVDQWSTLTQGQARNSVRIESQRWYNQGLFILDVEQAPWGCGVWPAWWTAGPNWPAGGEIDIIEGVHDNIHNQAAFHTAPGCQLLNSTSKVGDQNFTGWIQTLNCDTNVNSNSGCAIVDPSQASYGTQFNVLKGGIFAMLWAEHGISIWFFHRSTIPHDLIQNAPQPLGWGTPMAHLGSDMCNTAKYFNNHQIIFDITFCGDWAGNSYIDSGCPGTCSDRIMNPKNFMNASWTLNSLQVYRNPQISKGWITAVSIKLVISLVFLILGCMLHL